jgi:hypothetical protein
VITKSVILHPERLRECKDDIFPRDVPILSSILDEAGKKGEMVQWVVMVMPKLMDINEGSEDIRLDIPLLVIPLQSVILISTNDFKDAK